MEQRTDEWISARIGNVTASRMSDVMAKGKTGGDSAVRRSYMAELIAERLSGKASEGYFSKDMQWGMDQEDNAVSEYEALNGVLVERVGFIPHPAIKHFGSSPDGFVGLEGGVEIKCPKTATHLFDNLLQPERIDREYVLQMYAQAACTGRKWCDFISYDPRLPGDKAISIHRIEFSRNVLDEVEEETIKFLTELETWVDRIFEKRPQGQQEYIERWRS